VAFDVQYKIVILTLPILLGGLGLEDHWPWPWH